MHCTLHWDIRKYHYFEDVTWLNSIDNQETNAHSTIWRSPKKETPQILLKLQFYETIFSVETHGVGVFHCKKLPWNSDWATMDAAPSRIEAAANGEHHKLENMEITVLEHTIMQPSWKYSIFLRCEKISIIYIYIHMCVFCIIWHYLCIIDYIWYIIYTIHIYVI